MGNVVPGASGKDLPTQLGAGGTEMNMTQILPSRDSSGRGGNWKNVDWNGKCTIPEKGVLVFWEH